MQDREGSRGRSVRGTRQLPGRLAQVRLGGSVALAIGVVELLARGLGGDPTPVRVIARSLPITAGAYLALGLAVGVLTSFERSRNGPARTVAAVLAALAALGTLGVAGTGIYGWAASLALGWVVYRAAFGVARSLGSLSSPIWFSVAAALGAAGILATGGHRSLDSSGQALWLAVVATAGIACGFGLGLRSRFAFAPILPFAAVVVSVAVALVIGTRVPVLRPIVEPPPGAPSVLLITIDTLRADRVGAYGAATAHTPNLDALAREGTMFRQAVAHSYRTNPSHATMLTGLLPHHHGSMANGVRLSEDVETAAEHFAANGYVTAAVISGYTLTDPSSGLPSRFQYFDDELGADPGLPVELARLALFRGLREIVPLRFGSRASDRPAEFSVDRAIEWLASNGDRPYFLWVHLYDPHLPYQAPARFAPNDGYQGPVDGRWYALEPGEKSALIRNPENVARMKRLYDAEISYADHEVGRLRAAAEAVQPGDRVVTLVTSDHGESMGEHGLYWVRDLYDPSLMVPLFLVGPGVPAGREVEPQVRLVDLLPTLFELVGLPVPEDVDGESLVPLLGDTAGKAPGPAVSANYEHEHEYLGGAVSVRHEGWKLIRRDAGWNWGWTWMEGGLELYALAEDAQEERDVHVQYPQRVERLARLMDVLHGAGQRPVEVELDREAKRQLRSLGYVH